MITVSVYFDDDDITVEATFAVCSMAEAIGCEPEHASAYAGQYDIELHSCVNADTRQEHNPTPFQLEHLQQECLANIK